MRNIYGVMVYVEVEADDAREAEAVAEDTLNESDGMAVLASHAVSSRQEGDDD
jgi:hypothetical protein